MKTIVDSSNILVLASHSPELIRANCNRVIWLEKGGVKMDGAPDDVLRAYAAQ
jgi:lipopolysaccharide transport system ATP-binding protein